VQQGHLGIVRRWLWLIILSTFLAGLLTFWISRQQPLSHAASARLLVGPGIRSPNPDLNALRAGAQLMQTYAELPTTGPFLQTIINTLSLDMSIEELREIITLTANQETQILRVGARSNDPGQAVAITNAIAEALVGISPTGSENPVSGLRFQILNQVQRLEQNISALESDIALLQTEFQAASDLTEQRLIRDNISQERERLTDAHGTLTQLYEMLQTETTNLVEIIEPAATAVPVATQLGLKVLIGGMVGLILSSLVVLAFEYWNNTIDDVEGLAQVSDGPVLGAIAQHRQLLRRGGRERIVTQALPRSTAAENYRMLGTKLLHSGDFQQLNSVLLSTAGPSGDSGELAANLAVVLSQTGSRVVLVDANLHHPTIGEIFKVDGRPGLTDYLTGRAEAMELTPVDWAPGLSILPSGPVSYNSFALLASPRMTHLLARLEDTNDLVIVVASPILSFADSLFLATHVDGVILMARRSKTQGEMVQNSVASLRMVGASLLGTLLLNSRNGSVQIAAPIERRALVARHAQELVTRANGRKPLEQVNQQSNSGNGVTQSSASRSTKNVEQP
jgi:capsular exopolysaccharide synthesis family protein